MSSDDVQLPLQVLGDDGAQEAEGLHNVHWGFTQGDGGRWGCTLPNTAFIAQW